jgi:ABC-type polysaccharide/polyol phosphate transport system ATPase subunit
MTDIVISVTHVTKTYRIGIGRARVREMVPPPVDTAIRTTFPRWWQKDTFDALHEVSIDVPAGAALGILGHNGAGKTTLLRVVSGVTAPSAGRVAVHGRIAALIDALVGFHPDLSGRENVLLLGAMHGLGRRTMENRLPRILEFAEIGDLVDTPVKRFSAGMVARLGFATLTALDADVMLVDEVLTVGDAAFQRQCIGWLDEFRQGGGTLLFVSHNLALVRSMTERALWLDHGRCVDEGPTGEIIPRYVKATEHRRVDESIRSGRLKREMRKHVEAQGLDRWGAGGVRLDHVQVEQRTENGSRLDVSIAYQRDALDAAPMVFSIGFTDESGRDIGSVASPLIPLTAKKGALRCAISPLPLRSGIYFPVVAILSEDGLVRDRWKLDRAIVVERNGEMVLTDFGPIDIAGEWSSD